jgi:hypothetical protein
VEGTLMGAYTCELKRWISMEKYGDQNFKRRRNGWRARCWGFSLRIPNSNVKLCRIRDGSKTPTTKLTMKCRL